MARTTEVAEGGAAAEWARRIEAQEASGLSIRQFAAREGLKPGSLSFWRWKLRGGRRAEAPRVAPIKFVELTAESSPAPAAPRSDFEVVVGAGLSVKVPAGFDAMELKRLVAALEEVHA